MRKLIAISSFILGVAAAPSKAQTHTFRSLWWNAVRLDSLDSFPVFIRRAIVSAPVSDADSVFVAVESYEDCPYVFVRGTVAAGTGTRLSGVYVLSACGHYPSLVWQATDGEYLKQFEPSDYDVQACLMVDSALTIAYAYEPPARNRWARRRLGPLTHPPGLYRLPVTVSGPWDFHFRRVAPLSAVARRECDLYGRQRPRP